MSLPTPLKSIHPRHWMPQANAVISSPSQRLADARYQTIELKIENGMMGITLNRPDKHNAMSFLMMRELIAVATQLRYASDIHAVIIQGAGESFCSGIDLKDLNGSKGQMMAAWQLVKPGFSLFQRVCLIWQQLPQPTIAVIHGNCFGAGLQMALGCDFRIATPDTRLSIMEAKWGLVADMGLTRSAYGQLPADQLKELMMTARVLSAEQALDHNLLTHLSDVPYDHAQNMIAEMRQRSPDAVLAAKRLVNRMYDQSSLNLYLEKIWQLKLILGNNRKLALKQVTSFAKRQFN